MGVLLTAMFGGMSAVFAVSYVLHEPVSRLWPVALFWALTLANIDRLLLLITASKSRLLAMIPRLAISALLGFLIAEPLTLRIFQPEINTQIAITQQQAQKAQLAAAEHTYQPKITADDDQIDHLHGELLRDRETIDHYLFKKHVKQSSPDILPSLRLNHGPYYRLYKRKAAAAQANYNAVARGINSQIAALQGDVSIRRIAARRSTGSVPASSASHARSGHVKHE